MVFFIIFFKCKYPNNQVQKILKNVFLLYIQFNLTLFVSQLSSDIKITDLIYLARFLFEHLNCCQSTINEYRHINFKIIPFLIKMQTFS